MTSSRPGGAVVRAVNVLMGVLFALSVAVQYNDPDPVRWMLVYGAALAACVLFERRRLRAMMPAVVGLVAIIWAVTLLPQVIGQVSLGHVASSMDAVRGVEELREALGLTLVFLWMAVLAVLIRKRRNAGSVS